MAQTEFLTLHSDSDVRDINEVKVMDHIDNYMHHVKYARTQIQCICYVCTVVLTFVMVPSVKVMPNLDHRH